MKKFKNKHQFYHIQVKFNRRKKHVLSYLIKHTHNNDLKKIYYQKIKNINLNDFYLIVKIDLNYIESVNDQIKIVHKNSNSVKNIDNQNTNFNDDKLIKYQYQEFKNIIQSYFSLISHFANLIEKKQLMEIINHYNLMNKTKDIDMYTQVKACLNALYLSALKLNIFKGV